MIVSLGLHNTPQMQAKYEASESKLKKLQELSTSDKELIEKLRRRLFERKKQNGTALNMTTMQTYRRLIIPQAIPPAIPGLGNYLVGIFKDTPMLSVIGVAELIHTANAIGSETWRYLEAYTLVGIIFLVLSLPAAGLIRAVEGFVRRKLGMN